MIPLKILVNGDTKWYIQGDTMVIRMLQHPLILLKLMLLILFLLILMMLLAVREM